MKLYCYGLKLINYTKFYCTFDKIKDINTSTTWTITYNGDRIEDIEALAIEAEAGRYLDDGQVHTLTTRVVMVNSYGQSGLVNLAVRVVKDGNIIRISTFYPVSIV